MKKNATLAHKEENNNPGAFREGMSDCERAAEEDGLIVAVEDEEQATVTTREESTIQIVAHVVDMEEEDRIRRELDEAVRELSQFRHKVDDVVVASVIATDADVENGNTNLHANDGDLPVRHSTTGKCGTKGSRRWFVIGMTLLILVLAVAAVTLAMVLPPAPPPSPSQVPSSELPIPSPSQDPSSELSVPSPSQTPSSELPVSSPSQVPLSELLSSVSFDGGEALRNSSTPQYRAMEWLKNDRILKLFSNETLIQRYALATLYYSTNGISWLNHTGWLNSGNECEWFGVTCTATDTVSEIYFWENDLSGPIPPEIGLLTRLDYVLAKLNNLWGPIPTEIGLLTRLGNLYLAFNELTGSIPTEIGLLTSLDILELQDNQLEGTVPTEINDLGGLSWLYLAQNQFTGTYTCPDHIGQCAISCYDLVDACRSL